LILYKLEVIMAKAENSGRLTPSINAGVGRIIVAIIYEQLLIYVVGLMTV
jgi:hypothetical protein